VLCPQRFMSGDNPWQKDSYLCINLILNKIKKALLLPGQTAPRTRRCSR